MKAIVVGPPLVGKSTLAKYVQEHYQELPVIDQDDAMLKLNNGIWPEHGSTRLKMLENQVFDAALAMRNVLFMTYRLEAGRAEQAKNLGFTIFQLLTNRAELSRRNEIRLRTQPDNDAFQFVEGNLQEQAHLAYSGLVDHRLDATQPTDKLADYIFTITSR